MSLDAFRPQGGTILAALTTVASVGVSPSSAGGIQGLRITNISTNDAYAWIGSSAVAAALGSSSTPGLSFPILQRTSLVISCPPNAFLSAMTTGAGITAVLAITAGFGLP